MSELNVSHILSGVGSFNRPSSEAQISGTLWVVGGVMSILAAASLLWFGMTTVGDGPIPPEYQEASAVITESRRDITSGQTVRIQFTTRTGRVYASQMEFRGLIYQKDKPVTIAYDPKSPTDSAIMTHVGIGYVGIFATIAGAVLSVLGAAALGYYFFKKV